MKTRILHVTVRADYGGAPNYINTMINNLSDDFEIYLACPTDKPYYERWKENERVKGICLLPHRKFSIRSLFALRSFIKKNQIELLQANGKGAGVYGRLVKIFVPKLKVLFAYRGFHIYMYNTLQKLLYFIYERTMLLFTYKVINVSKGEQEKCIRSGVLTRKQSVQIYNGIAGLKHRENPELKRLYEKLFVIVTLSRFDIQKNMDLMFEIASSLNNELQIRFIFIGDGDDKERLQTRAQIESLRNIDFVGFKNHEEIAEYFSISDLYLTTSRWEGLPFALIEASSIGLPIIATDVIGNNEVCLDGINGILFPSEDREMAKEAIMKLYKDRKLLKELSQGSKRIFRKYFTVDEMVRLHEELYTKALNDS